MALGLGDDDRGPESHVARDGAFWENELQRRVQDLEATPSLGVDVEEALGDIAARLGLD